MRPEQVKPRHQSQGGRPMALDNRTRQQVTPSSNAYGTPAGQSRFGSQSRVGVNAKLQSNMRGPADMRLLNDVSALSG